MSNDTLPKSKDELFRDLDGTFASVMLELEQLRVALERSLNAYIMVISKIDKLQSYNSENIELSLSIQDWLRKNTS